MKDIVDLERCKFMEVKAFIGKYIDERMYLIKEGKSAILIDAVYSDEFMDSYSENNIEELMIILTHEHIDHIYAVNDLKERFNCRVLSSKRCAEAIPVPKKNLAQFKEVLFHETENDISLEYVCTADSYFEGKSIIAWQGHKVELFETPGHSPGSICVVIDDNMIFTGDSLIRDYKTVLRLPNSNKKAYREITIPFLESIDKNIVVYPGHGEQFYMSEVDIINKI